MHRLPLVLLILVALTASACGGSARPGGPSTTLAPLPPTATETSSPTTTLAPVLSPVEEATARWNAERDRDYVFIVNRGCVTCDQNLVGSLRVTVRVGEVVMVERMPMAEQIFVENPPTIDSLLSEVSDWLALHPEAPARFDPVFGFPLEAELGDQDSIVIEYLNFDLATQRDELEDARRMWEGQDLSDYQLTWERRCFCMPEDIGPFQTTVENGSLTASFWTDSRNGTHPTDHQETIDTLFDTIDRYLAMHPARLDVAYHPDLGYPTEMFADLDFRMADEEFGFVVTDLTP